MAMESEEKKTERNYLIPLWQDWKYGGSLATSSGACEPILMGITLELLTNEIIRPQPRPNEKDLHFNKILGQFIHILIFEKCCVRSLPFALQLPILVTPESSPYGMGNLPKPGRLLPTRRKNG